MPLSKPEPLSDSHELVEFSSGVYSLDDWLKRRARGNQASGATRTFVVAEGCRVVAYYAVASGAISLGGAWPVPAQYARPYPSRSARPSRDR